MVQIARTYGATPVIATLTPNLASTEDVEWVAAINDGIRGIAAAEHIRLADMERAFNNNRALMNPDLFHPNDAGTQLIANTFYRVLL
jgi:lysophospholipase L1-like esterase